MKDPQRPAKRRHLAWRARRAPAVVAVVLAIATFAGPESTGAEVAGIGAAANFASQGARPLMARGTSSPASPAQPRLTPSATARLQTTVHHGFSIPLVAWRPDGRELAVVEYLGRTVRLWDSRTGSQSGWLRDVDGQVVTLAYSPDGGRLATSLATDATAPAAPNLLLWDMSTRTVLKRLSVPSGGRPYLVTMLVYSPDGRHMAISLAWPGRTILYDPGRATVRTELPTPFNLGPMQLDPSGQLLAHASDDAREGFPLKIIRLADGSTVTGQGRHADRSRALAFEPSGRQLAVGDADGGISIYDVRTGRLQRRLQGHDGRVRSVQYLSPASRLVSAAADGVRVWSVSNGVQLSHCRLDGPHFHVVAISPGGANVVTGGPDELKVWAVCGTPGDGRG